MTELEQIKAERDALRKTADDAMIMLDVLTSLRGDKVEGVNCLKWGHYKHEARKMAKAYFEQRKKEVPT